MNPETVWLRVWTGDSTRTHTCLKPAHQDPPPKHTATTNSPGIPL